VVNVGRMVDTVTRLIIKKYKVILVLNAKIEMNRRLSVATMLKIENRIRMDYPNET